MSTKKKKKSIFCLDHGKMWRRRGREIIALSLGKKGAIPFIIYRKGFFRAACTVELANGTSNRDAIHDQDISDQM